MVLIKGDSRAFGSYSDNSNGVIGYCDNNNRWLEVVGVAYKMIDTIEETNLE